MNLVKLLVIAFCFISLFISPRLMAAVDASRDSARINYGQRGIIELYGGFSLNGSSSNFSLVSFSAGPGFNYFVKDNMYIGVGLGVDVDRYQVSKKYLGFTYGQYYKTFVDLGLGIPIGLIYKIRDHVYFNFEIPELEFYLVDLKHFRLYPNIITSFKFSFDGAVINLGIRHRFFHFNDGSISDIYYSYKVFLGLSVCFNTVKKEYKEYEE